MLQQPTNLLIHTNPLKPTVSSTIDLHMPHLPFFHSILRAVASRWPLVLYAATWTLLLTMTVAVAAFSPEMAFVTAISPSSAFSKSCAGEGFVRIPLEYPREAMCFPAHMVRRSGLDFFVPTVFAALVVAGSALVVRSLALGVGGGGG